MQTRLIEPSEVELVKLPYESPELKIYGTLTELTMNTSGPVTDG